MPASEQISASPRTRLKGPAPSFATNEPVHPEGPTPCAAEYRIDGAQGHRSLLRYDEPD